MEKNIEIEKKFKINNTKNIIDWLDNNTKFLSENNQEDILFTHENLSDRKILRLRKENNKEILTFKKLIFKENVFQYCDEFETEFRDDNMDEIFKILSIVLNKDIEETKKLIGDISDLEKSLNNNGFKSTYIINKIRKNYKYDSILLSQDTIKNLGNFIELEHLDPTSYEEALKDFNNLILHIKDYLDGEVEKGYLDLIKEQID